MQDAFSVTKYEIDEAQITRSFVYSLELIKDEELDSEKYHYLLYHEYLEFLCRIMLNSIQMEDEPIEYRLYVLLEAMY